MLELAAVADGTEVLDLGCGSGLLVKLSADRGARVSGIDICPELLEIARERAPRADLREGDISALPFAERSFDVVTGANALQFAPDPAQAFAEAARVLAPGGVLVAALFAEPERNEGTVLHLEMKHLVERVQGGQDGYAPYALSQPGGLEQAVTDAGLVRPRGRRGARCLALRRPRHHPPRAAVLGRWRARGEGGRPQTCRRGTDRRDGTVCR